MRLEWIAGEADKGADLRSWLQRGPLELKLALEIIIDICNGLLHAQTKRPGLVHRDLKPENILMAQGRLAKITDFGLAQMVAQAGLAIAQDYIILNSRQSLFGGQGITGTPAYMAPEQWRNEELDERTDIYALGCILYELLTGICPFLVDFVSTMPRQRWLESMQQAHETAPCPILPKEFASTLQPLLASCLAKARRERPADISDLLTKVEAIYQDQFNQLPPTRSRPGIFTAVDYVGRGITYKALGQYAQALADYEQALALDPNNALTYTNRGNTYEALGQYEAALTDFNRTLVLDPNYANAYVNRGNAYASLEQYGDALADFTRALALNPNDALAYANRGAAYERLGQYAEALADYERTLALDPNDATTYYNRGVAYQALGQHTAALADYEQALALFPNYPTPYLNIGVLLGKQGQLVEALPYLEKAAHLGEPNGARYAAQVRHMLGMEPAPQADVAQQAFVAFQQADSPVMMQQAVDRFPLLRQADFMDAIEQAIAQQVSPTQRLTFEQRSVWLRQIAN